MSCASPATIASTPIACVVCPVECFYQDDVMLYIDPVDCIDCEACIPECPVEAIFAESNVPAQWTSFTQLNAEKAAPLKAAGGAGHITEKGTPRKAPECKKKCLKSHEAVKSTSSLFRRLSRFRTRSRSHGFLAYRRPAHSAGHAR